MKHTLMETIYGTILTPCYQGDCIYYNHKENRSKKPSFYDTH
jgi:hypothetical protein